MKSIFRLNLVAKSAIGIAVIVFGWYAYRTIGSKSQTETYQTATAEKGTLVISISNSGQVSTANSSPVLTSVSGVVSKIYVKNGQKVRSGEKLLEIDLDQASRAKYLSSLAAYESSKNNLDSAKSNLYSLQSKAFAANQKLINDAVARGLSTGDPTYIQQNADWLAAEGNYKNQESAIHQVEISLNSAWLSYQQSSPIVYAPISGEVVGLSLQVGSVISFSTTSQRIATIQTLVLPTITINLTEIDAPKVKVGNKATVKIDAVSGKTFIGKVVSVDTVGSISSGVTTYPATIQLEESNQEILSNMSAQVSIILDVKDGILLVPSAAVQTQNNKKVVRVLKNNQPQQIEVEIGAVSTSQIEITSGLSEGDVVVTSSSQTTTKTNTTQTRSVFSSFGGGAGGNIRINR